MFKNKITDFVKNILVSYIEDGNTAVDLTAGNGYDTSFLSVKVGQTGKVYAFDIQQIAIDKTRDILIKNNLYENVTLINDGHENIDKYVSEKIDVAMMNLGYLPKGDKEIVTKSETSIIAINKVLNKLSINGVMSIIIYYGHEGGLEEKIAIENFLSKLDCKIFDVISINYTNRNLAPIINIVHRK